MQKISGRPNWEEINIHSERAAKILEIVRADWESSRQVSHG